MPSKYTAKELINKINERINFQIGIIVGLLLGLLGSAIISLTQDLFFGSINRCTKLIILFICVGTFILFIYLLIKPLKILYSSKKDYESLEDVEKFFEEVMSKKR
ncbi:MAG: hypothetical protein WC758_02600 [Candidatus Woesearchaeota archaeon]|jgi:hypothetical protein